MKGDELLALYRDIRALGERADKLAEQTEGITDLDGRSLGRDLQSLPVMLSNAADELRGNIRWFLDLDADAAPDPRKPQPKMVAVTCERCRNPFQARVTDRKRGWGRFCSKRCKAIRQVQTTSYAPREIEDEDQSWDTHKMWV